MGRRRLILATLSLVWIVIVAIVLTAIFGAWDLGRSGSGQPQQGPTNEVTRERDGVRLDLKVDKPVYGPGEAVKIRVTVTNTNSNPVEYRGRTPNERGFALDIGSELAGDQPAGQVTQDDLSGTIEAGGKLERQVEWDQRLRILDTPPQAPPGTYSVTATLRMSRAGFADLIELSGAVTFQIQGTPYIQPPLAALRAILTNTQVKEWAAGRGDNVVCAYAPRDHFFNGFFNTGSAAETFDELYKSQVDAGLPICGISTEGDLWRLVLFSPKGEEPHRLTVYVKLDSPEVVEVREGGPVPTPTPAP